MERTSELSKLARDGWFCKEDKRGNGEDGSVVFKAAAECISCFRDTVALKFADRNEWMNNCV